MKKLFLAFIAVLLFAACAGTQKVENIVPQNKVDALSATEVQALRDMLKYYASNGKSLTLQEIQSLATMAGASNFYGAIGLTGGTTGALDAIDGTSLADGDAAYVVTPGGAASQYYVYVLDDDSAAAESSPDVISPDDNAGDKRWILVFHGDAATAELADLAVTDSNFMVANGTTWVAESGATARTSMGVAIGTDVQAYSATLASLAGLTETNGGLPYGTADNAYAWLAAGAEGTLLMGNGAGAPSWLAAGTLNYVLVGAGAADPIWTQYLTVPSGGTGAGTLTDHGILLGSGTDAVTPLAAATNGQLPIGSTGADPVLGNITETGNALTVTNGAGTIDLAAQAALESIAGLVEADVSIIEGTADNAYAVVTSGGNNYILGSNADNSALEFKTPANVLSQISGQASSATLTSLAGLVETNGGLPYGTADNTYAWLAAGAEGTLLMGNGAGAPSWLAAGATTDILVGGGAADPVWTAATGTGAPVRANTPTLITPVLGAATGTSIDFGTTTLLASRALTVDTGGVFNINIAGEAGDDFTVDTDKLVVEGDTGYVGVGRTAPQVPLHVFRDTVTGTASLFGVSILEVSTDEDMLDGFGAGLSFWASDTSYTAAGAIASVGAVRSGADNSGALVLYTATTGTNSEKVRILPDGNVGIGTTAPNQKLTVGGSISLVDQAAAAADTAGYGQIWVSNATPDELWFTDDAGTDTQISSHPQDAPASLYVNGPGLDWIGKRVQKYLGVIFWQKIDGTITEETFEAYNLRRKDVPGHVDLVKRDWDTVQLAKLREQKLKEVIETEVTSADAFESVEIAEEVQTGTKSDGFVYTVDKDGKVAVTEKTSPIMTKQGTGKFEKKLKAGISFDEKTGKFISKRTMTEAEVDALNLQPPEMPGWMKTWLLNKSKVNK